MVFASVFFDFSPNSSNVVCFQTLAKPAFPKHCSNFDFGVESKGLSCLIEGDNRASLEELALYMTLQTHFPNANVDFRLNKGRTTS